MSSEQRQLRLHRTLLLSAGGGYLAWWLFVHAALPGAFNPFASRAAVVACFFAVYAASFRLDKVARRLEQWLGVCCSLATAHYYYLFDHNEGDLNWVVGSYITVTAVCAILQTSRTLLLYSLFVALLSVLLVARHPATSYVVFLPGMLTNLLFANVGMRVRLRLLAERRRAEIALVRANRDLDSFSYSIAHDLRAPLRAMSGFSRIVLEDYDASLDEVGKRHLERISAQAEQMGRLVDALLDLARRTRKELARETVDLSLQARTAAKLLQAANPERTVEVVIESGLTANGDPELLRAVIDNLIGNAWKFTAQTPSARIAFGSKTADGLAVYCVEDNGAGFDMAYVNKLFGAFQRLHTAKEYPGTGIGLATVQRIVERHGGRAWAEGAINAGAKFYFTLGRLEEDRVGDREGGAAGVERS